MTVEFTVTGIPCLGLSGGPAFRHSEAFSFQVATDDQAETDRYWNAIVDNGGQESECGWCKDKWGISRQITPVAAARAVVQEESGMTEIQHIHHEIDYIELEVTDMAAAKRFYTAAFGWAFNDYGPGYAGIRKQAGGEAGGLRLSDDVRAGGPLVILYSDDLEATLRAVRAAGGRITQEPFAFPGGRRFHFEDPSGNLLAVWAADGMADD